MAPAIFLPFAMALVGPYPTPKIMSALVGPSSASTPSVSMILKNERKTLTDRRPPPSWAPLKPIKNLVSTINDWRQRKLNKKLSVQDAILTANIRAMDERARASVTVRRDLAEDSWERMLPSYRRRTRDLAEDSWERLLPSMTSFDTFRRDLAENAWEDRFLPGPPPRTSMRAYGPSGRDLDETGWEESLLPPVAPWLATEAVLGQRDLDESSWEDRFLP